MLTKILIVLAILWLIGFFLKMAGRIIHLLIIVAIVLVTVKFATGII